MWSQEEFAKRAGIHRACVSSNELGKVSVGIEVANELGKALNTRSSTLVPLAE